MKAQCPGKKANLYSTIYTQGISVHRDMIQSNTLKLWCMVHFPGVGKDSGSRILDERQLLDDFFFLPQFSVHNYTEIPGMVCSF